MIGGVRTGVRIFKFAKIRTRIRIQSFGTGVDLILKM